jgi:hypothetical protein
MENVWLLGANGSPLVALSPENSVKAACAKTSRSEEMI